MTGIFGVSAQPSVFTEAAIKQISKNTTHPILFGISSYFWDHCTPFRILQKYVFITFTTYACYLLSTTEILQVPVGSVSNKNRNQLFSNSS